MKSRLREILTLNDPDLSDGYILFGILLLIFLIPIGLFIGFLFW